MRQRVGAGNQLHIDRLWQNGLPVIGCAGKENQAKKDICNNSAHGQGREHATTPAFYGCDGAARWERELQRVLRRANGDTLHASRALDRANLNQLVDR